MSGHTFKVGDRVRCDYAADGEPLSLPLTIIAWPPDSAGDVPAQSDGGDYYLLSVHRLKLVPLFEPVERWVLLAEDGRLSLFTRPGPPVHPHVSERWVKVVVSPAEDQS